MYDEAFLALQRAETLSGGGGAGLDAPALGYAYAVLGQRDDARRILDEYKELRRQRYVTPLDEAAIYAGLGDRDAAFERLEAAFEDRSNNIVYLKVQPLWDPLRSDTRFQDLLRRMNFPD